MKRPTWATVIGILMIIFGGCSVLKDLQAINLPDELNEASVKIKNNEGETVTIDSLELTETDSLELAESREQMDKAAEALNIPESTKTWIVRFGYLGILVSIIYMAGGIFLLTPKPFSLKLAYAAVIVSITFGACRLLVLTSEGSASGVIALTMGAAELFGIIIDIILLSVIFAAEDKEIYKS